MILRAERHLPWVGLLALLMLPALLLADVRDSTGLFSQNAVHEANATIAQIHKQTGKDVIVEVFGQIPPDLKSQYKPEQKSAFFSNWMRTRAQQLDVNGVYILVCRDPNYLDVGVGAQTRKRAFTMEDRNQLASLMLGEFKKKQYDQGLIEGMKFIQRTMQTNLGKAGAAPAAAGRSPTGSGKAGGLWWGWWVLIGIGVLYVIARLFGAGRRRSYYGPGPGYGAGPGYGTGGMQGGYPTGGGPGGYYPPTSGGGGFGRGLLGGLLGGAAGGWLYDRFRGGPTYGGSNMPQGNIPPDQVTPSDQGQGFEGTGGGFDDGGDQGGGFSDDSGGGDAGGGDFGGGDSGGGGDDSGGGSF